MGEGIFKHVCDKFRHFYHHKPLYKLKNGLHVKQFLKLINYSCTDDPIRLLQFGQVHGS